MSDNGPRRSDAVIVDAIRTPVGRRRGRLAEWHPVDLSAHVIAALVARNDLDPGAIDDVIWGCLDQVDEQAANVARLSALAAGFPESVPGVTVDRQCGSSQQALHFAAQGVQAGAYDLVVASGVESMSTIPIGSQTLGRDVQGTGVRARYADGLVPQGISAQLIAQRYGLSRAQLDEFALASHQKAARAWHEGWFAGEVAPVKTTADGTVFATDESVRPGTTLDALAGLAPAF